MITAKLPLLQRLFSLEGKAALVTGAGPYSIAHPKIAQQLHSFAG